MPRNPPVINYAEVEKLGQLQCTNEEVAAWFKVDKRTIIRWSKDEAFQEAMERGRATGRTSLRRAQLQAALKGNPTMLIWLGKQLLGQKDAQNLDLTSNGGDFALTDILIGIRQQAKQVEGEAE